MQKCRSRIRSEIRGMIRSRHRSRSRIRSRNRSAVMGSITNNIMDLSAKQSRGQIKNRIVRQQLGKGKIALVLLGKYLRS